MEPLQQAGAVLAVLVLLGATLYALRGRALPFALPMRASGSERRLEAIERLVLTPNHSLHLVRVEERTVVVVVSPSGCSVLNL